jgi:hypothetical protein
MKYSDPYLCGVALGLVLLASFTFAGRGLGASGAFASVASGVVSVAAPQYAESNQYFAGYLHDPGGPWRAWLLAELAGVLIGGFASAALAGRLALRIDRGATQPWTTRIVMAFAGGGVMGLGAVLARGCTSGQALTGGALLSVGSWSFMLMAFATGYIVSPALKHTWRQS